MKPLLLSQSAIAPTVTVLAQNEKGQSVPTAIPGEHPLTIYVNKRELVTLMTLGVAPEALVLGYLRNQRLVEALEDVASIQVDWETGAAAVYTRAALESIDERTAHRIVTTGCGQGTVFGGLLDELERIELDDSVRITAEGIYAIVEKIRGHPCIYRQAGSVHGCALFESSPDTARMLMFFEDVGRHNAVDAIAGQMWLEGIDGRDKVFYTTGRLTSEMVIKAAQMGMPVLMSRSGVTQMGYQVATQLRMTLLARCTGRHFLLFSGQHRFVPSASMARGEKPPKPADATGTRAAEAVVASEGVGALPNRSSGLE
ncbi:MAG: formate dehydrogenase accessory sulfurtransferase FdhD [Burkholderiaceae bacterium]